MSEFTAVEGFALGLTMFVGALIALRRRPGKTVRAWWKVAISICLLAASIVFAVSSALSEQWGSALLLLGVAASAGTAAFVLRPPHKRAPDLNHPAPRS